jgi:hypothetical protein
LCLNLSDSILLGRSTDTKIADVRLHRGYTQRWHPKKIRKKKLGGRLARALPWLWPPPPLLFFRCWSSAGASLPWHRPFPFSRCRPSSSPGAAAPSLLPALPLLFSAVARPEDVAATRLEDAAPSLLCRSSARGRHRHARDLDLQVLSRLLWKERVGGDLGRQREVAGGEGVRWYLAAWAA